MSALASSGNPLRVAIVGSGPAGFYTVSNFLKYKDISVELDMYDRLPTPFGLVRAGVAPDHQKYKTVTRAYEKSAQSDNFRFYGNVEYGRDIQLQDLKHYYHQIIFTTGAPSDRNLDIPGEDLKGSHSATDFVAWYNGHPDYVDYEFDLSQENVAVVGLGNVAIDVARLLCKTREELLQTDMADYAIDALSSSKVKNVYVLGRRGPAQAAFTPPEIKEMGELTDAGIYVQPAEAELDAVSREAMEAEDDKNVRKNIEAIKSFSQNTPGEKNKQVTIRFLVSPVELLANDVGGIKAVRMVKNEAYKSDDGSVRPRATEVEEVIPVGLVFRSVGYKGKPLLDIPFNESWGTILNDKGRVVNADAEPVTGLYTAGWIKRGPTGVIGTNKTCARETVACMVEDFKAGKHLLPESPGIESAREFVVSRQPKMFSYQDWISIDEAEVEKGEASNRPRVKFTKIEDMLALLGR